MSPEPLPGLIVQHDVDAPAALLGDWLDERGVRYDVVLPDSEPLPGDAAGRRFIVSLGCERSAVNDRIDWLDDELALLRSAARERVPILGICFGGQLLAHALGAPLWTRDAARVGWSELRDRRSEAIPAGPWAFFHKDAFAIPDGAEVLACDGDECQAFRHDRSLGLQFHPEVSLELFNVWVDETGPAQLAAMGVDDPSRIHSDGAAAFAAAKRAADRLFAEFFDPILAVG